MQEVPGSMPGYAILFITQMVESTHDMQEVPGSMPGYAILFIAQMVECTHDMQEVSGSMPGYALLLIYLFLIYKKCKNCMATQSSTIHTHWLSLL